MLVSKIFSWQKFAPATATWQKYRRPTFPNSQLAGENAADDWRSQRPPSWPVIQTDDGPIRVVDSYFVAGGKRMKHAAFEEAWVKADD